MPEKTITLYHTGSAHGPIDTAAGRLAPGLSLPVPEALAERLLVAYPFIKKTSDLVPGGAKAAAKAAAKAEEATAKLEGGLSKALADLAAANEAKEALEAEANASIEECDKQRLAALERARLAEEALAKAAPADFAAAMGELQAIVREFLNAGSKKDLEALQAKHKDAVPAVAA